MAAGVNSRCPKRQGWCNAENQKACAVYNTICSCPPPVNRKVIALFNAFYGQYACNPKYILLKLHEKAPDFKAYFIISDEHKADPLPEYARPVRLNSLKYKILFRRCNIYVTNFDIFLAGAPDVAFFEAYKSLFKKKKLIIGTWHGTPLKTGGNYEPRRQSRLIESQSPDSKVLPDFLIAGCKLTARILSTCDNYNPPLRFFLTGTPRCDILFRKDINVAALKEKLKLPKDKKIFLFAPTYRSELDSNGIEINDVYESGIHQLEELDVPSILNALNKRFGGEWAFVCRIHYFVAEEIKKKRIGSPYIVDGNAGDDMMEYLACADALLSDYSSATYDFALTRKPCFLLALDREHYENSRGLALDYDALPFPLAESCEALARNIAAFDEAAYKKGVAKLLDDIGNVEDGKASERIADCILHYIQTGEKRVETVNGIEKP